MCRENFYYCLSKEKIGKKQNIYQQGTAYINFLNRGYLAIKKEPDLYILIQKHMLGFYYAVKEKTQVIG